MYQAIQTKYLGPTNVRGSRVKATAARGSIILSWDDALNSDDNHIRAAQEYAKRAGWNGNWYAGGLPNGCVFVCTLYDDGPAFSIGTPHGTTAAVA